MPQDTFENNSYNRIYDDFCPQCKNRRKANANHCPCYLYGNGICLNFAYSSKEEERKYQDAVLDNQATTLWLDKKPLEEIQTYSRSKLRSILTKAQLAQFDAPDEYSNRMREALQSGLSLEAFYKLEQAEAKQAKNTPSPQSSAPKKQVKVKEKIKSSATSAATAKSTKPVTSTTVPKSVFPKLTPQPKTAVTKPMHYFYCIKDGKQVTYKRDTTKASYQAEVTAFKKYLAKQGIQLVKEEIK